jgi:hypothetical protein
MKTKETYYLVEYEDMYDGRKAECVCTEKGWKKYIKGLNEDRVADDKGGIEDELYEESMEENMEFIFTEIEVYN